MFLFLSSVNYELVYHVVFMSFFVLNIFIYTYSMYRGNLSKLVSDITCVFLGFLLLYTIIPMLLFLSGAYLITPLAWFGANDDLFLEILILHILFSFGIQLVGFFLNQKQRYNMIKTKAEIKYRFIAISLLTLVFALVSIQSALSAPIESYYDHYTRFDHHSGLVRLLISVLVRIYLGIIPFAVLFSVLGFRNNTSIIILNICALCFLDVWYSEGSRIQSLIIILQALCAYTILVRPVSTKFITIAFVSVVAVFTIVEIWRLNDDGLSGISPETIGFAGEFTALFVPELHLYGLRNADNIPYFDSIMRLKDFIELIPFIIWPARSNVLVLEKFPSFGASCAIYAGSNIRLSMVWGLVWCNNTCSNTWCCILDIKTFTTFQSARMDKSKCVFVCCIN